MRWQHPKLGSIPPDAFIPLAEETGNIRRLTRWVLAAGIAQRTRWTDAGMRLRIALNLSARDLDDPDLPQRIGELLAVHGVAPQTILLEITESAVMGKPEAAIRVLGDWPITASIWRSTISASASLRLPICAGCRCAS